MDNLTLLAELVKKRNQIEREITALVGRPAQLGHVGEYVASRVFDIELEESASNRSSDGCFDSGPLKGCTVNIKWYAKREGLLAITLHSLPNYYLVLTGPKSGAVTSRGQARPWAIDAVFLFESKSLVSQLKARGVKIDDNATSVAQSFWDNAEIFPEQKNTRLILSDEQRRRLALFRSEAMGA